MKTLFKTLIIAATAIFMATASLASAATINDASNDLYVFRTTNVTGTNGSANGWSRNTTIGDKDLLSFAIYYHVTSGTANDVTFKMENLNGKTFSAGETETVSGMVTTSNAGQSSGTSNVTFTDNVELKLYNVSWQPNQCTSVTCEQSFPGSAGAVLGSGINVGSIQEGWPTQGSMVITFKADKVNTTPTYADCSLDGVTVAHGSSRTFFADQNVDYGNTCSMYAQSRSCNDGVLSGSSSYRYATCTVDSVTQNAEVTTNIATSIDEDSARLNGSVDFQGHSAVDVLFEYGTSASNLNQSTPWSTVYSDTSFSRLITGLNDDTTYYFRAVVETTSGGLLDEGSIRSFRTDSDNSGTTDEAEVTTNIATNIDEDSARLNGYVDFEGYSSVDVYFRWGTSSNDLDEETSEIRRSSNSSFNRTITGLNDDTTYYFQAVVETTGGSIIDEGAIRSFRTEEDNNGNSNSNDDEPRSETESPRNIRANSAVLRGNVDMNDFRDGIVFFVYGEDEGEIEDAEKEDSYNDVDTDGDDIRKIKVDSDLNSDRDYEQTVSGLDSNARHYYRICVEFEDDDNDEQLACGDIEDFRTDDGGSVTNPNPPVNNPDAAAITRLATNITTTSASLRSFVTGEGSATCFFQYGRSTAFGATTPARVVNLGNSTSCESTRFNLSPNSTYYYRAVLVDDSRTYYGLTQSFRTNSVPVVVNPNPRPPVNNGDIIVNVIEQVEREDINEIELTKFISALDDARFSDRTEADRDETVFHKVVLENNGNDVLRDIVVTDYIPFELELDERRSLDDDAQKQVSWRIARLNPGETREFTTELRVRDTVRYGEIFDSNAQASNEDFTVTSNDVVLEVEERQIFEDNNANQGASIFGSGFFPDSLLGWLLLIVIALVIAYIVSRMLFARNENERVLAELRALQNNNS